MGHGSILRGLCWGISFLLVILGLDSLAAWFSLKCFTFTGCKRGPLRTLGRSFWESVALRGSTFHTNSDLFLVNQTSLPGSHGFFLSKMLFLCSSSDCPKALTPSLRPTILHRLSCSELELLIITAATCLLVVSRRTSEPPRITPYHDASSPSSRLFPPRTWTLEALEKLVASRRPSDLHESCHATTLPHPRLDSFHLALST